MVGIRDITTSLKARFCKDCGIPIKVYEEPYFTERLRLYDYYYDTMDKWDRFLASLDMYDRCKDLDEQYRSEYNHVKDNIINDIQNSEGYLKLNEEDMKGYSVSNIGYPKGDIFKQINHNMCFLSIDMKQANFQSLKYYDSNIFNQCVLWEEFVSQYTDNEHIIHSKRFRQVVLGYCNPTRQVVLEKYLMDKVLTALLDDGIDKSDIASFSHDEIIIKTSNILTGDIREYINGIMMILRPFTLTFTVKDFRLRKIGGVDGYYLSNRLTPSEVEFKGVSSMDLPFIIRKLNFQPIGENDKVFIQNDRLAKFIDVPLIEL